MTLQHVVLALGLFTSTLATASSTSSIAAARKFAGTYQEDLEKRAEFNQVADWGSLVTFTVVRGSAGGTFEMSAPSDDQEAISGTWSLHCNDSGVQCSLELSALPDDTASYDARTRTIRIEGAFSESGGIFIRQ